MNKLFDATLLQYAQVFSMIAAPLGDQAPRCRLLTVDYKSADGADHCQDIATGQGRDTTDKRLVELIQGQYAGMGFTVSAITEVIVMDDGLGWNSLYIRPGFMEESLRENGVPVPKDMAAAMEAVGICPVNSEELGWRTA